MDPLLFADATEMEKWVGPVLTTAAALAASLFAYLSGRDKLRYDAERVQKEAERLQMRSDIDHLTRRSAECEIREAMLRKRVDDLEGRLLAALNPE